MKKFIRPTIFIKGDRDRGKELLGVARAFLEKTLLWNKQKYFKQGLKLSDGSTIIVQKLMNEQFLTLINTNVIDPASSFVREFFFALDIKATLTSFTKNPHIKRITISVDEEGEISGGKPGTTTFQAGNRDFKGEYTWHGDLGLDSPKVPHERRNTDPRFNLSNTSVDSLITFNELVAGDSGPNISVDILYRYTSKVFSKGEVILDTTVGTNAPSGLVTGFCTKTGAWYIVSIWTAAIGNETFDEIWMLKGNTWTKLGDVRYLVNVDANDIGIDEYVLGRQQGISFSPDATKFTCVAHSKYRDLNPPGTVGFRRRGTTHFIEGTIVFDTDGIPIGITNTIVSTLKKLLITKGSTATNTSVSSFEKRELIANFPLTSVFDKDNNIVTLDMHYNYSKGYLGTQVLTPTPNPELNFTSLQNGYSYRDITYKTYRKGEVNSALYIKTNNNYIGTNNYGVKVTQSNIGSDLYSYIKSHTNNISNNKRFTQSHSFISSGNNSYSKTQTSVAYGGNIDTSSYRSDSQKAYGTKLDWVGSSFNIPVESVEDSTQSYNNTIDNSFPGVNLGGLQGLVDPGIPSSSETAYFDPFKTDAYRPGIFSNRFNRNIPFMASSNKNNDLAYYETISQQLDISNTRFGGFGAVGSGALFNLGLVLRANGIFKKLDITKLYPLIQEAVPPAPKVVMARGLATLQNTDNPVEISINLI